jgi:hypothetical protein
MKVFEKIQVSYIFGRVGRHLGPANYYIITEGIHSDTGKPNLF